MSNPFEQPPPGSFAVPCPRAPEIEYRHRLKRWCCVTNGVVALAGGGLFLTVPTVFLAYGVQPEWPLWVFEAIGLVLVVSATFSFFGRTEGVIPPAALAFGWLFLLGITGGMELWAADAELPLVVFGAALAFCGTPALVAVLSACFAIAVERSIRNWRTADPTALRTRMEAR